MSEETESKCPAWVADFDVMSDPEHHADPHPHYEELRATCPVARSDRHGGYWLVTRQADITTVMREVDIFSSQRVRVDDVHSGMLPANAPNPAGIDLGDPFSLTTMDPPAHTFFRRLLVPLFSARRVEGWEPTIRAAAISLLEDIKAKGSCDFWKEFASEFTIIVFGGLLGVPPEDRPFFRGIHEHLMLAPQGLLSPADSQSYQIDELIYYAQLIAQDDGAPKDTVVSFLNRAEVDGRALTLQEKIRLVAQFSRAGLHTTASALSNMMCYLASHPDQRDRLVHDPAITRNAVEELLRFESIASPSRLIVADTELGGQHLRAGEMVHLPLMSAGRDEEVFEDPQEVNFDRSPIPHIAFSLGRHRCIGLHLARTELRIALEEIHRLIPTYRLAEGTQPVRHTGAVRTTNELWLEI